MKGGISIPNNDFIITALNIEKKDIEKLETIVYDHQIDYYITLNIKKINCEFCGGNMYSNGTKLKVIKHPTLRDYDGHIFWRERRYQCSVCHRTSLESNHFTMAGFKTSYAVIQRIMNELRNINTTYTDIAKRNCVSVTTVQTYFDSWVNIPA